MNLTYLNNFAYICIFLNLILLINLNIFFIIFIFLKLKINKLHENFEKIKI